MRRQDSATRCPPLPRRLKVPIWIIHPVKSREGTTDYFVKTSARAESIAELSEIYLPPVLKEKTTAVRLKDIAVLERSFSERTSVFYCANDNDNTPSSVEGVRIQIRRQNGYSPVAMAENLLRELPEIQRSFGRSLDIRIISDRSRALKKSMNNLVISLLSGAVFAFLVILLFMKNIQRALILLVSLPASLLFAVLLLFLCGKTLNLMSLGGLALGVGMVVDNSIVITERLSRRVMSSSCIESRRELISLLTAELAPSLAGSTVTTVIVFMPLLFIKGLPGALLGDLGLSVILALSASLAVALALIPVLYLVLNPPVSEFKPGNNSFVFLRKILRFSLRKPFPVLLAVIILFAAGLIPLKKLPIEVVSPINEGMLQASVRLAPGTNIEAVSRLAEELSVEIIKKTDAFMVSARAGGENDDPYYLSSTEESAETIQLEILYPVKTAYKNIARSLKTVLDISGGSSLIQPPENILENLIGGRSFPEWMIIGDNPLLLRQTAAEIAEKIPGAGLVPADEKAILKVYPDRAALASYGIDISALAGQLSGTLYGTVPVKLMFENREIDVRLRAEDRFKTDRSELYGLTIPNSTAAPVRMQGIAGLVEESALPWFLRKNRKDISVIRLENHADEKLSKVLKNSGAMLREENLLLQNLKDIIITFITAGILLFLCLGIQFESVSIPLLLMLSIPPGAAGILTALFLFGSSINLNSCLGILAVMGISVNNGILLFEESRRLMKTDGALPCGALYRGTASRLRPIIMTGLTTVVSLIPLAVNPYGTSSQSSLAIAVIGGLSVSTVLSLLIIPNILRIRLNRD